MKIPKRWIVWQDLAVYGGYPLFNTGLALVAAVTPQAWPTPKVVFLSMTVVSVWAVFGMLLLRKWRKRPTFVTLMGTAVWANGQEITQHQVNDAINFYTVRVARAHKRLDLQTVLSVLSQARIEFTERAIWFSECAYGGLQKGANIRVHWGEGFDYNAFFHACHHLVDELLLDRMDHKHTRMAWWDLIPELKSEWAQRVELTKKRAS